MLKPKHAIVEEETEAEKEEMRKKSLAVNAILEKEMEERELVSESEEEDEDKEDKWDCQSILSTLTNKDNHPGIIKTNRVVKLRKHKLEMHKQLKVPIDGLIAEEIEVKTKANIEEKARKLAAKGPYAVDEEIESGSGSDEEEADGDIDPTDMKKLRKKQIKQEKRDKRKLKKELKMAFKTQNSKLLKSTTTDIGALKSGVSVRKIY